MDSGGGMSVHQAQPAIPRRLAPMVASQSGRVMNTSDTTTFELDHQSGQHISNVGGDQTVYYGERSRATRLGKVLAALGLALCLVGLALMVAIGITTARTVLHAIHSGAAKSPYTQYLPPVWPVGVGLLAGGLIVNRVARIVVGR
jgi:hypothetical protein